MDLHRNVRGREKILLILHRELIGPWPAGRRLRRGENDSYELFFEDGRLQRVRFRDSKDLYRPWRGPDGEEILKEDPRTRYGVAVLRPPGEEAPESMEVGPESQGEDEEVERVLPNEETDEPDIRIRENGGTEDPDFEVSLAYQRYPSAAGITFLLPEDVSTFVVRASGARYLSFTAEAYEDENTEERNERESRQAGKKEEKKKISRRWWIRVPVGPRELSVSVAEISNGSGLVHKNLFEDEKFCISVAVRIRAIGGRRYCTLSLVNRSEYSGPEYCLFQSRMEVDLKDAEGGPIYFPPLPAEEIRDDEDGMLEFLYRNRRRYARGHGCAAFWKKDGHGNVYRLGIDFLPQVELTPVDPEIRDEKGRPVRVSMRELADWSENGREQIRQLLDLYESWIEDRHKEASSLADSDRSTALQHMSLHRQALERMKEGYDWLFEDEIAREAFCLANRSVLYQQLARRQGRRSVRWDRRRNCLVVDGDVTDVENIPEGVGYWRGFQIAFILMNLKPVALAGHSRREEVDLIWFPTGGGKTEAYLGLIAFAIWYRRLVNPEDAGTHAIMRYTLRLLTAQQFQRASSLMCAMEYIRRNQYAERIRKPVSGGIWVGGGATPNTHGKAIDELSNLQSGETPETGFPLTSCPWCGAALGERVRKPDGKTYITGYCTSGGRLITKCPDSRCPFHVGIPVYFIDEDIYERRPDLIIATVDKFATLAWNPRARSIFGLDANGKRCCSPPGLIIQDELHLITGPLGSMMGLYEMLIEELCTDRRDGGCIRPRIICATATTRGYRRQIQGVFARDRVFIFPPPALDIDDSFFARPARLENGAPHPGKIYLGIMAPGLGSLLTVQVRVFSALLQAAFMLREAGIDSDPWWTLVVYFNSIRELGGGLTLFGSDIPDYLAHMKGRQGLDKRRLLNQVEELTGRISSNELPRMLDLLERSVEDGGALDAILVTNIIEVGVDVDRLSLMSVVGQPKSGSTYIQATGRVGRRWKERPGLIVTLYNHAKPRDHSVYEDFRGYHERIGVSVEPASVTPFSLPALERALHAVMVAAVRQMGRESIRPDDPDIDAILGRFEALFLERVRRVEGADPDRRQEEILQVRRGEWKCCSRWNDFMVSPENARGEDRKWVVPTSMRHVDREVKVVVK